MKRNIKYNILGWLSALALLPWFVSCSDFSDEAKHVPETPQEKPEPSKPEGTEPFKTVSLFVNTIEQELQTRGYNDGTESGKIGNGQNIDILVFAIYDEKGERLDSFSVDKSLTIDNKIWNAGEGQNIIKFESGKAEVVLTIDTKKTYQIACWAQSSKCNAYDFSDLTKLKVSYVNASNNDEYRDAFSGTLKFTADTQDPTVTLYRPFAQINVGTTGADYVRIADSILGFYITQTSIKLSGLAQYLNVLNNEINTNNLTEATFEYKKIPAYCYLEIPDNNYDLVGNPRNDVGEEFLKVDLDGDGEFKDYKTSYPTIDEDKTYLTETFKYLSMCYVLVPAGESGKTTLEGMTIYFKNPSSGYSETSSKIITNIPVGRNWRTNILGGLSTYGQDSSITDETEIKFVVVCDYLYDGDNNRDKKGDEIK